MYYEIGKDLYSLQQGSLSISEYYGKMRRLWEDLHEIEGYPECTCGILEKCSCNLLKKVIDAENRRRLVQFLMGVDSAYDHLKQMLLAQDPLPAVNHALSRLIQAERQKKLSDFDVASEDTSALMVTRSYQSFNSPKQQFNGGYTVQNKEQKRDFRDVKRTKAQGSLFCRYYKKDNHEIENCYKLKNKEKYNKPVDNRFAATCVMEERQIDPLEFEHHKDQPVAPRGHIDEEYLLHMIQKVVKNIYRLLIM
ncbi:hypothetical protein RND81_08G200100 [Saponaria officinalis]|uniref:Retrotransposon gag domain-containing protein n=1 Tax=Saponaria officinalis TaxID=3572 RepID=A0AAW1J9U0_SAPOF